MVKCYAQTLCLKDDPDLMREYRTLHANSWPEILDALKQVGVLSMKIFLKGTRMFMYFETVDEFDPAVDFPRHMEITPRAVDWGNLCCSMQVRAPEAGEGDWWTYMEQVYDFQSQYAQIVGEGGPMDAGVVTGGGGVVSRGAGKPIAAGQVTLTPITSNGSSVQGLGLGLAGLGLGLAIGWALGKRR